jgi:DNA recombination protein RmuC
MAFNELSIALVSITLLSIFILLVMILKLKSKLTDLSSINLEHQKHFAAWLIRFEERNRNQTDMHDSVFRLLQEHQDSQHQQRIRFDQHQINSLTLLQDSLQKGMTEVRQQVNETLMQNAETIGKRVDKLTQDTDQRLKEISGQVEKRLAEGFEKTTATFHDVLKRLALIDEAQKKITELSGNVVSLQEILSDKRSRGAFGEVQLSALIRNVMPEQSFSFQHTLSNGKRPDCILLLPEPTGHVAIDAKFPLESFRTITNLHLPESERRAAEQQFRLDIRKHIQDIASKYIIDGETSDGAVMFIPAEAVFAEIHAHFPDIIELSQKSRVWLVSPTTMMAILTTARAVLKDAATRQQVHIIQEHLGLLSKDFDRFQTRMENLSRHIKQAYDDAEEVKISSRKISSRFNKIEQVELENKAINTLAENVVLEQKENSENL